MKKRGVMIKHIADYLMITVGAGIFALAFNIFLEPNNIVPGGVTGLAMVICSYLDFPVGACIIAINLPLFILGGRLIGMKFLVGTVFGTVMSSVLIDITAGLFRVDADPLLATVFGGILMGTGLGLVFSRGATTGGSDVAARLLKLRFKHLSIGRLILGVDVFVIALAAVAFGSVTNALYAVIAMYISSTVLDAVVYGSDTAKVSYIISDKSGEIVRRIGEELGRGATVLHGEGGMSGVPKRIVMCAVKRQQIALLKELVSDADGDAFIVMTDAHEVLGEGFGGYAKNRI